MTASAVVVGGDSLALATTLRLRNEGIDVLHVRTDQFADLRVSLARGAFEAEGRRVGAILMREPPSAMVLDHFVEEDRPFVFSELSATWLAATELTSVLAVNCLGAGGWFEEGRWQVWQRRLRGASVDVSVLSFGDADAGTCWRPYVDGCDRPVPAAAVRRALGTAVGRAPTVGSALSVCGEVVAGQAPPAVARAARLLAEWGLRLVSIGYDSDGRVGAVGVFPPVTEDLVDPVAARLASAFHDHLRSG